MEFKRAVLEVLGALNALLLPGATSNVEHIDSHISQLERKSRHVGLVRD